jgi:peptidoglycan/xylan/chitin deacetylase (PgdA/CDA1 family)
MYDLIITNKKLNIKKVIVLITLIVILIVISTILGMKKAEKENNNKYANELQEESEKLAEQQKKEDEETAKKQEEIQLRTNKISTPLTEEQKYNILHIYNSTGEKRVFLTFDDGPTKAVTPFILDILKQENIKATFFLLGTNAKYNPDLIKREFDEGHYIGNHGYSHRYKDIYASPEATLAEYSQTQQIIRDALQNQSYLGNVFRFPGGSNGGKYNNQKQASKELLLQNGIVHLDWNALSEDAAGQYTKEQLLANVEATIGDKSSVVILMHDSSDKILTYEMLPDLINYLKQQGYSFKNIYDLL